MMFLHKYARHNLPRTLIMMLDANQLYVVQPHNSHNHLFSYDQLSCAEKGYQSKTEHLQIPE